MTDDSILEIMRQCRNEFAVTIDKFQYVEGEVNYTELVLEDR